MSNIAFVIRQGLQGTRVLKEKTDQKKLKKVGEVGKSIAKEVDFISDLAENSSVINDCLGWFDAGDLGMIAGIELYNSLMPENKGEISVSIGVIPDLACLAVQIYVGSRDNHYILQSLGDFFTDFPNQSLQDEILAAILGIRYRHERQVALEIESTVPTFYAQ